MERSAVGDLLREGTLDAELAALVWLLVEGGVPLIVAGETMASTRSDVASALLSLVPRRGWVLLDVDAEPPTPEGLAALLRGGVLPGMCLAAADLGSVIDSLTTVSGLPEDAIRRLGTVAILAETKAGLRLRSAHYLRPTERDGQGHVQRRPPAVLATWDEASDSFEHFAWGITPELAERVGRSQADLEERQRDRSLFLAGESDVRGSDADDWAARLRDYLGHEPPRVPAPLRGPTRSSPSIGGLTDPHVH